MAHLRRLAQIVANRLTGSDPVKECRSRGVAVGERTVFHAGVIVDFSHGFHIEIGDDVTLAPRVHILAHDASTKKHLNYTRLGKVKIGNRVFVGADSIVLPGVFIGDDVVVGAGSVVTRDIPARSVAAGNPARVVSSLDEFLEKRRREMETSPRFGPEYADTDHLPDAVKKEMNDAMKNRIGYIL